MAAEVLDGRRRAKLWCVADGVIGKDLSNPIPSWAEHGAEREVVPYTVGTDMDSPNPDSGEEYFSTNTQLFNIIDDHKPVQDR